MVVDASRGVGVNASGIGINFGASLQTADGKLEVVTNAGIPQGLIVMFSGAVIPQGWALYDGTNDLPDLLNRFMQAARQCREQALSKRMWCLPTRCRPVRST